MAIRVHPLVCGVEVIPQMENLCQIHVYVFGDANQPSHPSDVLFSFCPQSFPASRTFPMSRLFAPGDQKTRISASALVLPMSIQGWFPLRLTGWISFLSRGLSGVFFSTAVPRYQLFGALPSLWSSSHNRTWLLDRPYPWLYTICLLFNTLTMFVKDL